MEYTMIRDNLVDLNDVDLVLSAQEGDLDAFNKLVLIYQDSVFAIAYRILGDEASAEDIVQDSFLIAYRSLPRFRNGSFRSWLYRIVTNACYDELRRRKRHPLLPITYEDEGEERYLQYYDLPGASNLPEQAYERRELEQVVQRALDQLDEEYRAVVVLVDLEEFDYRKAAQILGIPIGTLKSRLTRARRRLRVLL